LWNGPYSNRLIGGGVMANKDTVLVISDTHFPAHHPGTLDFLSDTAKKYKPTRIVHIGDEVEWASLSFHDKDPRSPNACEEYTQAFKQMKKLFKLFPKIDFCESNHGSRNFRVAFKSGLPNNLLKSYREIWEAPNGAKWHKHLFIDGVKYSHGDPYGGRNAAYNNMMANHVSVVQGHTHVGGGVGYTSSASGVLFYLNVGCLIDIHSHYFDYGSKFHSKPTIGCGVVLEGQEAHFVRLK
jgi:hypothetical protein